MADSYGLAVHPRTVQIAFARYTISSVHDLSQSHAGKLDSKHGHAAQITATMHSPVVGSLIFMPNSKAEKQNSKTDVMHVTLSTVGTFTRETSLLAKTSIPTLLVFLE
ncbi:hypothetical protein J6590_043310 [Homalodisca vitripennis]|nr:hypothetical protein J6590_043310 [Homalodisca vitripennis]